MIDIGRLESLAGKSMTVAGRQFKCEIAPFWNHCDFDSIWFINVRNNSVCLTHMNENLNSVSYQRKCNPKTVSGCMKTTIFALDSAQVPTVCEINVTAPMKARTKQTSTVEQEIIASQKFIFVSSLAIGIF